MSYEVTKYIGDVRVEPGAVVTNPLSMDPILGRRLHVGAVCESVQPESWRPLLKGDNAIVWQGDDVFSSHARAEEAARAHARTKLDAALRELFS